ncbi:hypothetical protein [Arthrobacter yangruifuii]|uniref:hypothetical protein n=1 Tax=Arthrobacter yangruifuii TaxID=2606616 RepID=UPI001FEF6A7A|nr:hypothetical protein [Arthrobacter yangruifuii]
MTEEPVTGKAAAEDAAAAPGVGKAAGENRGAENPGAENPAAAGEDRSPDPESAGKAPGRRRRGHRRAVSPGTGAAGLLPVTAKEDDPRVWGDAVEDNDSWLREQRPPHWG